MLLYFVILHYQDYETTIKAIESILELQKDHSEYKIRIIVVDNASPNHSYQILREQYKDNEAVMIKYNQNNDGFAKGNNIGYKIAKENDADFIVLINNDTLINDRFFASKVVDLYQSEEFGVLGPDIYSVYEGIHQNPMKSFAITGNNVKKRIHRARMILLLNKLGVYELISHYINSNRDFTGENYKNACVIDQKSNLVLHGSCLIFSKEFIKHFNGLYDKTFMYYEEHILAFICQQEGIKMFYSPEIHIEHYRKGSTKAKHDNRISFFQTHSIESLKCLNRIITGEEDYSYLINQNQF